MMKASKKLLSEVDDLLAETKDSVHAVDAEWATIYILRLLRENITEITKIKNFESNAIHYEIPPKDVYEFIDSLKKKGIVNDAFHNYLVTFLLRHQR